MTNSIPFRRFHVGKITADLHSLRLRQTTIHRVRFHTENEHCFRYQDLNDLAEAALKAQRLIAEIVARTMH